MDGDGHLYRSLLDAMPFALWQVDASWVAGMFGPLVEAGVTDIDTHLREHPELVEAACDNVVVRDVNRKAMELFGCTDRQRFLQPTRYFFHETMSAARRVMASSWRGERVFSDIFPIRTFDDRVRDMRFTTTRPDPPRHIQLILVVMEDVTDQLRAERQLSKLRADFEHVSRLSTLGEMASSIAHEVRQPLASMSIAAEAGLRWLTREVPDPVAAARQFSRIAEDARLASEIIERILSMARLRESERVTLDLNLVIDEALAFLRHELETRQIIVTVRSGLMPATVQGDRVLLQQLLVNLVLNAAQAIDDHAPVRREIRLNVSAEVGMVDVSVEDTGAGIPAQHLDRIFDSFFTTRRTGMGIGLAVCQSIAAAHAGTIQAANAPEGGARFRVRLPFAAT